MNQNDYDHWRQSPVADWFFENMLGKEIAQRDADLGAGSALSKDPHECAFNYALSHGITAGIELVRSFDPFKEERNEVKSNRPTSPG